MRCACVESEWGDAKRGNLPPLGHPHLKARYSFVGGRISDAHAQAGLRCRAPRAEVDIVIGFCFAMRPGEEWGDDQKMNDEDNKNYK